MASLVAGRAFAGAPQVSPWPVPRPDGFSRRTLPLPDALIARADLGGKLGYVVADERSGEVLEALNPLLPMPPASVAKTATASYALAALGGDYRFHTRLIATGPVHNGRLEGDLILAGSGDPVLKTDDLAGLAAALKQAGLRQISGRFLVWAGALPYQRVIDNSQPEHLGYNPSVSGLNLNYNRVYFEWKPAASGYTLSMDARSEKYRPQVASSRMRVVDRKAPVYTYAQDGDIDRWTVARAALGDGGGRWLPVRRPDLYVGEVFGWLARAQGMKLPAARAIDHLPEGRVLALHESPPLVDIVRLMLKYSINLVAEAIGLTASQARGEPVRSLRASAARMNGWMKRELGTRHARLIDHSGLSDKSRISASDLVKALVAADGRLHQLMKEVVPLDENGSARKDAGYAIRAKTGSLNFVSTLAGYIEPAEGRPLVFAMLTGDIERRVAIPREQRERPKGARSWALRSRWLQHRLIDRWVGEFAR